MHDMAATPVSFLRTTVSEIDRRVTITECERCELWTVATPAEHLLDWHEDLVLRQGARYLSVQDGASVEMVAL